ncbi:excinuclease ABC subunit UvrA [Pseudomonas sp. UBA4194]|uniref:excinuclease ABC subunit UvrA n=1 Tax=Pseudomonas sp. UBA4194 TaxID=1947317 RepID=UPI0025E5D3D7|nr:excinuclease ABC subunit UvrA [Pseudomonas sp. UBA4194]
MKSNAPSGYVQVRGAREHNLQNVDVDIPRDALVVFTGVSGSGKSSLAFGTLYAEAQRRYFESVAPYARRLIDQVGVPDVDSIDGLPPAVALQQQRGTPSTRSSVGSVTTLGSLVRMLYSRAGAYPKGQPMLYAEDFSPNTPQGACPHCHGLGRVYEVTEQSMVPDDSLTIRQRAVASWPLAWQGQNQRDILVTLGYDVDIPWRDLPRKQRDWILFTEETPTVPVYAGLTPTQTREALKRKLEPSYQGTFTGARRYVLHTFTHSQSALMKKRVSQYMVGTACQLCEGKRLKREALSVTFAGLDIGEFSRLPLNRLAERLLPVANGERSGRKLSEEKRLAAQQLAQNLLGRLTTLIDLGLGYLSLERSTPTLSSGELQRLRLATQLGSQLFGVVYVLDEPTAGLHPADGEALHDALKGLKAAGNSLFVVEHDLDTMARADWLVDVGPRAGVHGGTVLYSGPPQGLADVEASQTRLHLFGGAPALPRPRRATETWLELANVTRNNLQAVNAAFPLHCFTAVTGISGSGKSSLVSQVLLELVGEHLGQTVEQEAAALEDEAPQTEAGHIVTGMQAVKRLVQVDQKPIGRTPRSNLATYTGLFDHVRKLFAAEPSARKRGFDAGQFSFNVAKGRCPHCEGEGFVSVELLFMPSVFTPCPTCHGARYNPKTLEVLWQGRTIAQVLELTVDEACEVFAQQPAILRSLTVLRDIGLGYLRLGQPATELSGGEAQRIKLATELQRSQRGATLYVLDEPTTGLHPSDVDRLMTQLNQLVDSGNSVVVVEHDMRVVAQADWVIDIGPGAGDLGGKVVATGRPETVAECKESRTASYLQAALLG